MATQEIPSSGGDYIDNVVNASWQKGSCPPGWTYNLVASTPLSAGTEMGGFN